MRADLFVFGDSIAFGAFDTAGGWVQRLKSKIDQRNLTEEEYAVYAYNVSISGDTTEDLLVRIKDEYDRRCGEKEQLFIFAIGINDTYVFEETGKANIDLEIFKKNISELYNFSNRFSEKIAFVSLTPVDEALVVPVPWRTEISYKNEVIATYNSALEDLVSQMGISFIDVWSTYLELEYENLLSDGLHPNPDGHKVIAELVEPLVKSWGIL